MPSRILPARPDLDHLKHEARALRDAFSAGDAAAVARVHAIIGERPSLKLTEAQRVIAREYGFATWAKLRTHVQSVRGADDPLAAFLDAVLSRDAGRALDIVRAAPHLPETSLVVAAVLGRAADVRRLLAEDPARVHARVGSPAGDALLWLCYSPFHGESPERDDGLAAAATALLEAGADPNTADGKYRVPALYAVTGFNEAPRVARILLDAGANPTDGESVFHAAENFHEASLALLLEYGVDLNHVGDWGNTALYFLLRYWDVAERPATWKGVEWLLEHGADVHFRRSDGRTAWDLARRNGDDALAALLEAHGAEPGAVSPADELMAACGRGDVEAARALATPDLVAALEPADLRLIIEAAAAGRFDTVRACIAAGLPVKQKDENGATALHYAALHGRADITRALLAAGAEHRVRDREHRSAPLGWACWGADHVQAADGDYADTVRALLDAGAEPKHDGYQAAHEGVRAVLAEHAAQ